MNNILNNIKENLKNKEYVVSCETSLKGKNLIKNQLKIKDIISFSNYLNDLIGLGKFNKKIGILLSNSNNFVKAFYSVLINEHIVVSISDKIEKEELKDIIKKNNLKYIISENNFIDLLNQVNIKNINIDVLAFEPNDKLNFDFMIPNYDDILVVSYTSGTSGNFSKGVMLSCENISVTSHEYKRIYNLDENSQIITVLPLWHNYSMFACLTSSIVSASKLIIMKKWDSLLFLKINVDLKPNVFPGSPYMYIDLINNFENKLSLMKNLKVCDSGGDSLPIECIKKFEEATGAIITEGYGLTETTSLTHFNFNASERKVGSLGKCVNGVECKILDLDGNELLEGQWGILWIKGPMVFEGYVGLPLDNKTKDGWFNTNDVVKKDQNGFYYIAGRFSDLQSLTEDDGQLRDLENSLYKFDGIKRVHVQSNYNNVANFYNFDLFVILKDNYTIKDLYDFINNHLKKYVINSVNIVDELPTTGTGKVKRNKLIEKNTIESIINNTCSKLGYSINKISGGMRCNTYIIQNKEGKKILQTYENAAKYQAEKKYNITKLVLNNNKIKLIPNTLAYGVNDNYSWLISEYKEGIMLEDARKTKDFSLNNIHNKLAECLNAIHSTEVTKKYGWITDKEAFENERFCDFLASEVSRFKNSVEGLMDIEDINFMMEKANDSIKKLEKYESQFMPTLCWYDINPNNLLVDAKSGDLKGFLDAGGVKIGIKELDLAFYKMEVCKNEQEYQDFISKYKEYFQINEEIIDLLSIFIELDDMSIRVLDKVNLPKPYNTNFNIIIDKYNNAE